MTTAVVKLALADIRAAAAALDDARTALADIPDDLTVAAARRNVNAAIERLHVAARMCAFLLEQEPA